MKISSKILMAAAAGGIAVVAATGGAFANAHLRLAGGVYGIPEGAGYGRATIMCLDKNEDIAKGVTIKTHPASVGGGIGVTFTCP